jgi:hypothetical protein
MTQLFCQQAFLFPLTPGDQTETQHLPKGDSYGRMACTRFTCVFLYVHPIQLFLNVPHSVKI